jgi:hypothetical protein
LRESSFAKKVVDRLNEEPDFHAWLEPRGPYSVPGVADVLCCARGALLCIETKRPGEYDDLRKGLRQSQVLFERDVTRAKGLYYIADSMEHVELIIVKLNGKHHAPNKRKRRREDI